MKRIHSFQRKKKKKPNKSELGLARNQLENDFILCHLELTLIRYQYYLQLVILLIYYY